MAVRFEIVAAPDPQALSRLLEPFALRGLLPCRVLARVTGDRMVVQMDIDNLDEAVAGKLVSRFESGWLVHSAEFRLL